jgi:ABC-type transport system involved in multi-copper enzyme maturation permease subunit
MMFSLQTAVFAFLLALAQVLAALPWLAVFNWQATRPAGVGAPRGDRAGGAATLFGIAAVAGVVLWLVFLAALSYLQDPDALLITGRVYAAVLQVQLAADLIVAAFAALLLAWPKGGAVALAAFREGIRQPMFWLLAAFGLFAMAVSPFIPYFTFGEDHKMVEELGYDTIMGVALLFGALAASMSISEEIEGRTAVTLMSKPVSRRQFLLGKFLGILLAAVAMTFILGWCFDWVLIYKRWYDRVDPVPVATPLTSLAAAWLPSSGPLDFVRGIDLWANDAGSAMPGLVLGLCQVMVLLAVAVSLATRLPMVINLVICLGVYFAGHLTPVLVQIAHERAVPGAGGLPVAQILSFMAQLFDTILPGLDYFSLGTAVVRDNPLPLGPFFLYVGSVVCYAVLYTLIVLVFGLILFEDRDLA